MERPQKRPRLGLAPHDESDDDDELNYEPEEISQRRDPSALLARSRATAAFGLKSAFESIFERYERDFEGVADEIDLRTADIVVDNRHLEGMRNERDMGNVSKEIDEEEIPAHDGGAARDGGGGRTRGAFADDEDEDQILQERSTAMIRKAPSALTPRMPSSLAQRPGISSHLGGPPQLPSLGASPLFFGSWGPPGAMDPAWQAPQLQVPQFKSSFAANLFTGRYQLPAREASRSIWAAGSHSDDDEDGPPEKPRTRLAPPTRRIPARPKAMKLIRAPPTNADESGDEDFILMGVNASQVFKEDPKPPRDHLGSRASDDEADLLLDRLERELEGGNGTEYLDGTSSATSTQPVARARKLSAVANSGQGSDRRRDLPDIKHLPPAKKNRGSHVNKRKARRVSSSGTPLVLADESSASMVGKAALAKVPTEHTVQDCVTNQRESVVIELPSSCVLDDGSYLDFSGVADLLTEDSHSLPIPEEHSSPCRKGVHNKIVEDHEDSQIPSSDRTIPDSQDPPVSLPPSSASNAPTKQIPEKPRQEEAKHKASSLYDLSDDEVGFLARPPRKRKRISDSAGSTAISEGTPAEPVSGTDGSALSTTNRCVEYDVPSTNKPATAQNSSEGLFSPTRTSSAKARTNSTGASLPEYSALDEAADSASHVPEKRRLTPTSLNSTDDTEGETLFTQGRVKPRLPVALVSPPPETETAGMVSAAKEGNSLQAEPLEPVADAVLIDNDDRPRSTRSTRTRTTRGRPEDATADTPTCSEPTSTSHDRPVAKTVSSYGHRPLSESQNTVNSTPSRKRHGKLAATGPFSLQFKPVTPSKLRLSLPNTPTSAPSTGHRSLTSLVPEESPDSDSEDELTTSSLFSLFQKPTPEPPSSGRSALRRRAPEGTPTKVRRRVSAVRLTAPFSAERPSAPEESVMRTPGGTIRKCGERGLKCGKDFCFTCC